MNSAALLGGRPAHADLFVRKCDVDRAEACLIALGGLKREAHNV